MASSYSAPVSAAQVGSYFVGQYYQVLQQQPDLAYQFYADGSTVIRIDGDSSETASTMMDIHGLIVSLNFASIEIKTINSLESWNGGILVMVSGSVKTKDFIGRRKFVQSFFLAPQEKGYFVLNDMFQYVDDGAVMQHQLPLSSENKYDVQLNASSPLPQPPVSEYNLEEEAREYMNSVHIEDDTVDKYSIPEQEQQQELEAEVVVEETLVETSVSVQNVNTFQEPLVAPVEDSVEEPSKKTYASILRVAKSQSAAPVASHLSSNNNRSSVASETNRAPQPAAQNLNHGSTYVPESAAESADGGFQLEDEEPRSVYVKNLPSSVTPAEIEQEFKNFGRIKPDGIFIRQLKDVGSPYAYAFVEFEDLPSVQTAIQASPIQLAGRLIYIEERRPNRASNARGGRRGRGRGSYQTDAARGRFGGRGLGRGGTYDSGDYISRGNGYQHRSSR